MKYMTVRIVMWMGAGLIIIGTVGLIVLFAEPLIRAFKTVVFKKQYDQSEDGEDVEKGRKLLKKALIILVVAGFAMFVPGEVLMHLPEGFDSTLYPEPVDDDNLPNRPEDEPEKEVQASVVIVEGKMIRFNGQDFKDVEEFDVYLDGADKEQEIKLKDEYAIAGTFHQTENALKEKGIRYVYYEEAKGTE